MVFSKDHSFNGLWIPNIYICISLLDDFPCLWIIMKLMGPMRTPPLYYSSQPREINRNYTSLGSFSGNQGNKMLCAFFLLSKSIQIKIDFAKTYRNLGGSSKSLPAPAFTVHSRSIIRSIFGHEKSHHLPKKPDICDPRHQTLCFLSEANGRNWRLQISTPQEIIQSSLHPTLHSSRLYHQ